jgi:protein ImuB
MAAPDRPDASGRGREVQGAPLAQPLLALGWWALQYTPKVALLSDGVLLEVSASTRLWGGRAALLHRIYTSNKPVAQVAYAQGASSLVALGRLLMPQMPSAKTSIQPSVKPNTQPDDLPLNALMAARPHLSTLERLGCSNWGQLRALPRAGLARRFGAALVDALDQAYGHRPDVYPWLTLPEVFDATLELSAQVDSAPALLFGARRLLAQLQVWLRLRQRGVLAIELGWNMDARRNTATQGALVLRTAQASADVAHLQRLLGEHLKRVSLPAPVLALRLRSLETQALQGTSASLLLEDTPTGDSLAHLLERLSARLGSDKVLQLQPQADHRPEQMQVALPAAAALKSIALHASGTWASALFPTWLLAQPLKLMVHQQQPFYQGPLTLVAGPQRLESGWWGEPTPATTAGECAMAVVAGDPGTLALRDYFVARCASSVLLWIYRERLGQTSATQPAAAWYLHGIFA